MSRHDVAARLLQKFETSELSGSMAGQRLIKQNAGLLEPLLLKGYPPETAGSKAGTETLQS